jgi:hypothetical protein
LAGLEAGGLDNIRRGPSESRGATAAFIKDKTGAWLAPVSLILLNFSRSWRFRFIGRPMVGRGEAPG